MLNLSKEIDSKHTSSNRIITKLGFKGIESNEEIESFFSRLIEYDNILTLEVGFLETRESSVKSFSSTLNQLKNINCLSLCLSGNNIDDNGASFLSTAWSSK